MYICLNVKTYIYNTSSLCYKVALESYWTWPKKIISLTFFINGCHPLQNNCLESVSEPHPPPYKSVNKISFQEAVQQYLISVSYTHLDVYKRQTQYTSTINTNSRILPRRLSENERGVFCPRPSPDPEGLIWTSQNFSWHVSPFPGVPLAVNHHFAHLGLWFAYSLHIVVYMWNDLVKKRGFNLAPEG